MIVTRNITPPLSLPIVYLICLEVLSLSQQIQISESPLNQFNHQNKIKLIVSEIIMKTFLLKHLLRTSLFIEQLQH